jgi:osmotically-inducible protein OsmY
MKTDAQIQNEIINELNRESAMVASEYKVFVKNHEVVLEGVADSYAKKIETERAALRVSEVKSVSNNIVLKISTHRSDEDIKKTVMKVITWNSCIDENKINVEVNNGRVALSGEVEWEYQKTKASILTSDIMGVVDVTNNLHVISGSDSSERKLSA